MEDNNHENPSENPSPPLFHIENKESSEKIEKPLGINIQPVPQTPAQQNSEGFIKVKDLKIIMYTNLVSYFIVFRIFITVLSFISFSIYLLMFIPILILDILGLYGARKLSMGLCVSYSMYIILDIILKGASIIYFSINLVLSTDEVFYTYCLKVLVICVVLMVFEALQAYMQIKFCQKISLLSPESTYLLERVIRGNSFPLCMFFEHKEEVEENQLG